MTDAVIKLNYEEGSLVVVSGNIRSPSLWKSMSGSDRLLFTAGSAHERDEWSRLIRVRLAPWSLLKQRVKDLVSRTNVENFKKLFERMLIGDGSSKPPDANGKSASATVPDNKSLPERMQKWDRIVNPSTRASNVSGGIATAIRKRMDEPWH